MSSLYARAIARGSPIDWIAAALEQHRPVAEALDRAHVVRDEEDRLARGLQRCELSKHFCWNAASPTASTSSTSRMSASTWIGDREREPHCMPEE